MSIIDQVKSLSKSFTVPDLIAPGARFIFVLESPHIQEILHGAPVSGSSGKVMARHLLGNNTVPIGIRLKAAIETGEYQDPLGEIGLANICPIPMQGEAYPLEVHQEQAYDTAFEKLDALRKKNGSGRHRDPDLMALQEWIVEGLKGRLFEYDREGVTWVPCGKFAQKFFMMASDVLTSSSTIPLNHPSFGGWDKQSGRGDVVAMKEGLFGGRRETNVSLFE